MAGKHVGSDVYTDALTHNAPVPGSRRNLAWSEGAIGRPAANPHSAGTPEYLAYEAGASAGSQQEAGPPVAAYAPVYYTTPTATTDITYTGELGIGVGESYTISFLVKHPDLSTGYIYSISDGSNTPRSNEMSWATSQPQYWQETGPTPGTGNTAKANAATLDTVNYFHICVSVAGSPATTNAQRIWVTQVGAGASGGGASALIPNDIDMEYQSVLRLFTRGSALGGFSPSGTEISDFTISKTLVNETSGVLALADNPFLDSNGDPVNPSSYGFTPIIQFGGASYDWTGPTISNLGSLGGTATIST